MYYGKLVWKWKGLPIQLSKLEPAKLEYIKNTLTEKKGFWYGHNYKYWLKCIELVERDIEYKMVTETIAKRRQQRLIHIGLRVNIVADRFLTKLYDFKCSNTQEQQA